MYICLPPCNIFVFTRLPYLPHPISLPVPSHLRQSVKFSLVSVPPTATFLLETEPTPSFYRAFKTLICTAVFCARPIGILMRKYVSHVTLLVLTPTGYSVGERCHTSTSPLHIVPNVHQVRSYDISRSKAKFQFCVSHSSAFFELKLDDHHTSWVHHGLVLLNPSLLAAVVQDPPKTLV